jgi:hypothetical protein
MLPGGTWDTPCTSPATDLRVPLLPPIGCRIAYDATASTNNDTTAVFLQRSSAVMSASTHVVTFTDFTLTAPLDNTYALSVQCYIGSIPVPQPHAFLLTIQGCPVGMAPLGITCSKCGVNEFSTGAKCTACPRSGVDCTNGILTPLQNYYRPASQVDASFTASSELYPCYNAEACTLNVSTETYGCAVGYSGPLCGVCDASANYAAFGEACRPCWSPEASSALVAIIILVLFLILARVALRQVTPRSSAAIMLRITMSFVQGISTLRAFQAGGTQVYHSVMGWTDSVSASPLAIGVLQCFNRTPFLAQYIFTIIIPVIVAVAVVVIFVSVAAVRATQCKPTLSFAFPTFQTKLQEWWNSKRHLATLLVVLLFAYMPITSSSLRTLDCYDFAIDGKLFLRTDLSVQCDVGQHAIAKVIAYVVLVVVGICFPLGLLCLLGSATSGQLSSADFQSTWGFLFDGYRGPPVQQQGPPTRLLFDGYRGPPVQQQGSIASSTGDTPTRRLSRASITALRMHAQQSVVWWEALVLLRKAGVVLLAVLVTNPYLQCVGGCLWFGGFLLLHLHFQPYVQPLFNRMETLSLSACSATASISTVLLQYQTSGTASVDVTMTGTELAATILMIILNLGTFCVLAGMWLWFQFHRAHTLVKTQLAKSASGRFIAPKPLPRASFKVVTKAVPPVVTAAPGVAPADGFTANPLHAPPVATTGLPIASTRRRMQVDDADTDSLPIIPTTRRPSSFAPRPSVASLDTRPLVAAGKGMEVGRLAKLRATGQLPTPLA